MSITLFQILGINPQNYRYSPPHLHSSPQLNIPIQFQASNPANARTAPVSKCRSLVRFCVRGCRINDASVQGLALINLKVSTLLVRRFCFEIWGSARRMRGRLSYLCMEKNCTRKVDTKYLYPKSINVLRGGEADIVRR